MNRSILNYVSLNSSQLRESYAAHGVKSLSLGVAGQVESVDLIDRVPEVGVDFEAVEVADHQERRVFRSSRYWRS
jgi:hypothetical protein